MAWSHDLCYSITDIRLLLESYGSFTSVLWYLNFVMPIVTCLVGFVGNAVVIFFLGFVMKNHKSKYWFLNLAIADFLCVLSLPLHAISALKGNWTFGRLTCRLFLFSSCANMYSSVYILISLNIVRVLSVARPMFHLKFITQRVSFWVCALIWFITILFSLPLFFYAGEVKIGEVTLCSFICGKSFSSVVANNGYNVSSDNATRDILVSDIYTKLNHYFEQCSSDTCCGGEETLNIWNDLMFTSKWFVISFVIVGYFVPLVIVIICNITIAVHVRKSKTVNTHRLYRIIPIIIMVYFITWTPVVIAYIVLLIAILSMNLIVMINVLAFMPFLINFAYTNCFLNPIIYMLSGEQMRTGISDCICSIRNKSYCIISPRSAAQIE